MAQVAYKIEVKGLVQGVGFRPFIYKLARKHAIRGRVENNNRGVLVRAEGELQALRHFIRDIEHLAPEASQVSRVNVADDLVQGFPDFVIGSSRSYSDEVTEVSPDIAVCADCLRDMKTQPHRIDYPFTNCTHCGPRFSIIKSLPYDRSKTTMAPFVMCDRC
ncbi:MAG TPA: carbamoyltransferase HypF, partial [Bacteroidetes bacterium]|nr:carbamoyltransferase HypF [Bacteroidota bacterium]